MGFDVAGDNKLGPRTEREARAWENKVQLGSDWGPSGRSRIYGPSKEAQSLKRVWRIGSLHGDGKKDEARLGSRHRRSSPTE
jgi:hypothetical protein